MKTERKRDGTIDVIRGLCIVTIMVGHLCEGSHLWHVVHFCPWIDGASGFILLAGPVLGMVYRRTPERDGSTALHIKQFKRIGLLFTAHVSVVTLAIVIGIVAPREGLPDVNATGWASMIEWLFTLQLNPEFMDILPMYVLLLAMTLVWVPLLRAERWPIVMASSVAVYVVGLSQSWGTLPNEPGGSAYFSTACWQLLFSTALVVGWHWNRGANRMVEGPRTLKWTVGVGVVAALVGTTTEHTDLGTTLFGKPYCGPGRIVVAWCAFLLLYRLIRVAGQRNKATRLAPLASIPFS